MDPHGSFACLHAALVQNTSGRGGDGAVDDLPLANGFELGLHVSSPGKVVLTAELGECNKAFPVLYAYGSGSGAAGWAAGGADIACGSVG